jgi:hypothetical protein
LNWRFRVFFFLIFLGRFRFIIYFIIRFLRRVRGWFFFGVFFFFLFFFKIMIPFFILNYIHRLNAFSIVISLKSFKK